MQKTIISGTDREFEAREADTQAQLPKLSATWLKECRNFFLTLLLQDSPTVEDLLLATTIFNGKKCKVKDMGIEKALSHTCTDWSLDHADKRHSKKIPSEHNAEVFYDGACSPWDLGYSEKHSHLIREIVLECGEDLHTITTKEMIKKDLCFARFQPNGRIKVLSWYKVFNSRPTGDNIPCHFLQPYELVEYRPDQVMDRGRQHQWGCLQCWRVDSDWRRRQFDHLKGVRTCVSDTVSTYSG